MSMSFSQGRGILGGNAGMVENPADCGKGTVDDGLRGLFHQRPWQDPSTQEERSKRRGMSTTFARWKTRCSREGGRYGNARGSRNGAI